MTESRAIEILEYSKGYDGMNYGAPKIALDNAIKALEQKEQIKNLLKCHNDFSAETAQINYEIVKAIRVILGIDERR